MATHRERSLDPLLVPQRRSVRLRDHDYAGGIYFLTICVAKRSPLFGRVEAPHVRLTPIGEIVQEEWLQTGQMRSGVWLDAYVIMPDHLHGIVGLGTEVGRHVESRAHAVRPYRYPQRETPLGRVVAGFKSACTRRYRAALGDVNAVLWQRGYYEHVIRGSKQLQRARQYIADNPWRW
jgi:putative transposase